MGELGFFGFFASLGAMVVAFLVGPVGQAIGRRIGAGKKDSASGVSTGEMAAEQVASLEGRIQELEERLDFAERALLKGGEAEAPRENTPR